MKKTYEYKTEDKNCSRNFNRSSQAELDYLYEQGKNGWELVSVIARAPMTTLDVTTYYWKRENIKY